VSIYSFGNRGPNFGEFLSFGVFQPGTSRLDTESECRAHQAHQAPLVLHQRMAQPRQCSTVRGSPKAERGRSRSFVLEVLKARGCLPIWLPQALRHLAGQVKASVATPRPSINPTWAPTDHRSPFYVFNSAPIDRWRLPWDVRCGQRARCENSHSEARKVSPLPCPDSTSRDHREQSSAWGS